MGDREGIGGPRWWPAGLLLGLLLACDGEGRGVPTEPVNSPDAGLDGQGDGPRPPDVPPSPPGLPDPPSIAPHSRRLLPARSQLLGLHRSGCSHGPDSGQPGGSRWCAISRPGDTLGALELWVLDVSRTLALPEGAVSCDGSSPHCVRLTSRLFDQQPDSGPGYPTGHRFHGDTLIYYAEARSGPGAAFRGTAFAWRPGWPDGQAISGPGAVLCSGHPRAAVASCLENASPEGARPVTWELHAGPVHTGPLRRLATIFPIHPETEASQWGSTFTPGGERFLFSTPGPATAGRETLFSVRTADIGQQAPATVGDPGVSRWTLSADGRRLFYLRDHDQDRTGSPSGTLFMRDLEAGTERRLQGALVPGGPRGGVGAYHVLADADGKDAGLGLLVDVTAGRGRYLRVVDLDGSMDDPANVLTVLEGAGGLPVWSPDLRFFVLGSGVFRADGSLSCPLPAGAGGPSPGVAPVFSPDARLLIWTDGLDAATGAGEGWVANPEGCAGQRAFSQGLDFLFFTAGQGGGAGGLLVSDRSDGQRVDLRYLPVSGGQPGEAQLLQRQVERLFAVLPDGQGVLFTISSNRPQVDGLYHLPLPP